MFSIARYQGDDDDSSKEIGRTFEKKNERLQQLREKANRKRKTTNDQPPTAITTSSTEDRTPMSNKNEKKRRKKDTITTKNHKSQTKSTKAPIEKGGNEEETENGDLIADSDNDNDNDKEQQENIPVISAATRKNDSDDAMEEDDEKEEEEEEGDDDDNDNGDDNDEEEKDSSNNNGSKEKDEGIVAFPDMIGNATERTQEDIQLLRNMGIPDWLLLPTVISPSDKCELDELPGISDRLVQRCRDLGFTDFFAVQLAVIPVFLRRQALYDTRRPPGDLCVSAPTGSGKTIAYVLPIIDILSKRVVTRLRALVVLPTRELAIQVKETFEAFVKGTNLRVGAAIGQHSMAKEQQMLVGKTTDDLQGGQSRVDILIATPGRLTDHIKETKNFSLQHLRFLVIDEADQLLNQSYNDWLNQILTATRPSTEKCDVPFAFKADKNGVREPDAIAPNFLRSTFDLPRTDIDLVKVPTVQKLLFSATLTKNPAKIAGLHLTEPEYISVQRSSDAEQQAPDYTTPEGLKEFMTVCSSELKPLYLIYLLNHFNIRSCLCFTRSTDSTRRLQMLIEAYEARQGKKQEKEKKFVVADYSSELTKAERKSLLKKFSDGEINLLICSDLIGRGIDLDNVAVVINYDVPYFMDKYIHRVGRTARAGRQGEAYSLVEKQEARPFKDMFRQAGHLQQIKPLRIDYKKLEPFEEDYNKALSSLE